MQMLTTVSVSHHLEKYIKTVKAMNKATAKVYNFRIGYFDSFVYNHYRITLDDMIEQIKKGNRDPYDVLNNYICYLQENTHVSPLTLKQLVITVKNFLEYNDVDISPRKFKLKVKLPKAIRKNKEALSKEDVVNILNSCSNIRLKTYVMLLASTGARAVEALSIRIKDFEYKSDETAKLFIRGEFTKTKTDRLVFLTEEMTKQLTTWLDYKYRTRRICYIDKETDKTVGEYRTPKKNPDDLVFAVNIRTSNPGLPSLYVELVSTFDKTLDRIGMDEREEEHIVGNTGNNTKGQRKHYHTRRKITLHSFRRFVKTTISDLGYSEFSEWFIGHAGSTYWRKKDLEKAQIFHKIEPSLTFLDFPSLERKGADFQTKIDTLEQENQKLRQHDSVNKDALSTLSDQVMKLMVEVQELKKNNFPK
jgi:integrase